MASESEPQLTLAPGNILETKFFYVPERYENLTVRPDEKISLQLVAEIDVRRKTPLELKEELVRAYTGKLRIPEVTVIVRSLSERRVYVAGEVKTPGFLPLPGRLTILEAMMEAGGFNLQTASFKSVVVTRQKAGQHYGIVLTFQEVLGEKEVRAFYLEPRYIV